MRTLAHLSDLHFGAVLPSAVDGVLSALHAIRPDLVVVSGDFTQRAREWQFKAARQFLDQLPFPKLLVPGNHDVPLFNLLARFLAPTDNYRKYLSRDLSPVFRDDEIIVLGINTARSLTWKNGRVSREQMEVIRDRFCEVSDETCRILVTHHPFVAPPGKPREGVVGRAEEVFLKVHGCVPDLALAGHYHTSYAGGTHEVYTGAKGSTLVVQAGTAVSTRTRLERNAFNIIAVQDEFVRVDVWMWDGSGFAAVRSGEYAKIDGRWALRETERVA